MEFRIGGGQMATVTIDENDAMSVEGVMYDKGTSITFYEGRGGDDITIFFPSRDRMKQFAEKIIREISEATGG